MALLGVLATTAGASPTNGPTAVLPVDIAGAGQTPSVSGDGARIAFVAVDPETGHDRIWLSDRAAESLTLMTDPGDGVRDGDSRHPMLSRDGCSLVIVTELAIDLFRDDDLGERWDVYRTILPGCEGNDGTVDWQLVSTTSLGEPTARNDVAADQRPAVNASGGIIVYARQALPGAGEAAPWTSLDVVDLTVPLGEPGRITRSPGMPESLPATSNTYVGQRDPVISDDGVSIAFTSDATITVIPADPEDPESIEQVGATWAPGIEPTGPATTQVYLWSLAMSADDGGAPIQLVSADTDGRPGNGSSNQPAISAFGNVVVFASSATGLTAVEVSGTQVYRAEFGIDRVITLVSAVDGVPGDGPSTAPSVDASGELIAFVSTAGNLTPLSAAHRGAGGDVLVANLGVGSIERLTMRPDGLPARPSASAPNMSASGRVVAFSTTGAVELSAEAAMPAGGPQIAVVDRPPVLSISNIDVGTVEVGLESTQWFTTLQNLGPSAFVPGEIVAPAVGMRLTGGTCVALVPVAPGSSCTVSFAVTPMGPGPFAAEILIHERNGPLTATAIVSGSGGVPSIVAAPAGIVLDAATVGSATEPTVVTIINTGAFPEPITGLSRGGSNPADLDILIDGCTGRTLQPGETCEVAVALAPSTNGPRNTILTAITEAGATASIVIDGRGVYLPGIAVDSEVTSQRRQVTVTGLGFPANAILTVGWTDDDRAIRVGTDAAGVLRARLTPPIGRTGQQTITVLDPELRFEPIASRVVLVTAEQERRRRPTGG